MLASVVVFAALFVMIDRTGQSQTHVRAPAIVVLGARVLEGGHASGALRARVERAVELFHEGAAPLVVLSGGVGDHPPSEARVALEVARKLGVPEEACLLEEESHSTYENAVFTARLLKERGIDRVIVVSDPYHLFRARQHFRLQGIDAHTVPALMTERNLSLPQRAYWTAREVIAVLRRPWLLFATKPRGPASPAPPE